MNKKFELLAEYAGLVTVRNHLMTLLETSRTLFAKGDQNKIANLVREMDKELLKVALSPNDVEENVQPVVVVKTPQAPVTTENMPVDVVVEEKTKKSSFRRAGQE